MKKALALTVALVCAIIATGCATKADDGAIDETAITVTLDTASGSAIPAQFNADVTWKIKDADWKAGDAYVAQACFAGTGDTSVEIGSPLTLDSTQEGTIKYAFKIPDSGLPSTVKKPYELTIVVKKDGTQICKSDAWTFTEGAISGTYTGTLNYYTAFNPSTGEPTAADSYDYKITLSQYGTLVVGTNVIYINDSKVEKPQTCTVVMTSSTTSGKTKLTGIGTYTNGSGVTTSYSGEAYVFGDGRTISCDAFWLSTDATKKSTGDFNAELKGTASISGVVSIDSTEAPIFDSTDPADEDTCYAVVLYGFGESDMEDNAGRIYLGPVEKSGTVYSFTYTIENLPAGSYYLMFGGIDGETGTPEADRDHMPWTRGEAVGLYGLAPDIAVKWIDGKTLTGADKTAFDALVPVTVSAGQAVTGKDISAIVRSANK